MAPRLRTQVFFITAARVVFNTAYRMVTPLLPAFRDGLGVTERQLSISLAWRSGVGAVGPFLASIADSYGRKTAMLAGMFLFSAGISIVFFSPTLLGFTIALALSTLGKFVFDPAMQAYLGDRVPYHRRGFVLGIVELGWSGAFLVGVPIVGVVIARAGWLAPFPLLAVLGLVSGLTLYRSLPPDSPAERLPNQLLKTFRAILSYPVALAGLAFTFMVALSNELVGLVIGLWLEDAFALQVASLGAVAIVIGLAELGGEGLVSALVDRLGKRRAITYGLIGNALTALLLPILGRTVPGALAALFLFFLTFEFTFVSAIPLMTEVFPQKRATFMALNFAAASLGRGAAAWVGIPIFQIGFFASALAAALVNGLSIFALRAVSIPADE